MYSFVTFVSEIMKFFLEMNNNFDNLLLDVNANLQAYGCDQGWTDFKDYCYTVLVGDVVANIARNRCESMGASLSSVWSQEEKQFIVSLWQVDNGSCYIVRIRTLRVPVSTILLNLQSRVYFFGFCG